MTTDHEHPSNWASRIAGRRVEADPAATFEDLVASRKNYDFRHLNVDLPSLGATHLDIELGRVGRRPVRADIYVPHGEGPFGTALFLHGGAWYVGDAANERKLAMQLAQPGLVVINLSYALAPEDPFPCALEDVVYAARWITRHISAYSGDPTRVAIVGASAGGNLAAAAITALHSEEHLRLSGDDLTGVPVRFNAGAFFYGVFDVEETVSGDEGLRLHSTKTAAYLGSDWRARLTDPLVSPARSTSVGSFPPCYLNCGSRDALLPQTLDMTRALASAGVAVDTSIVSGADHVFLNIAADAPRTALELRRVNAWLAQQVGQVTHPVTSGP